MKTGTNCDSQMFVQWVKEVEKILVSIPLVSANDHMPLEYSDDEYQQAMKKLQQCAMQFDDIPIYPINEQIAVKLIEDQLKEANDKPDI